MLPTLETVALSGLLLPPAGLVVHLSTRFEMVLGIARPDGTVFPKQPFSLETAHLTEPAFGEALRQLRELMSQFAAQHGATCPPQA